MFFILTSIARSIHYLQIAIFSTILCYPCSTQAYNTSVDVAIVGAGLSGLSTAQNLIAAGNSVLILEATDRVGGKVLNAKLINGGVTEVGAEFVGPTQDKVLALITSLGLETYDTYSNGSNVLWSNNTRQTYSGSVPPMDNSSLIQAAAAQAALDGMAVGINVSAPWSSPNALEWDSMTFGSWLDTATPSPAARSVLETFSTSIFSAQSTELSLLYVVAYIASAGNETLVGTIERLTGTTNAAQAQRVQGGTQLIAIKLAQTLGIQNIVFNAAVRDIKKITTGYEVSGANFSVNAKQVVVAMSPPLSSRINYDPILSASRDQLTQRMPMGSIGKAIAVYETPFWRDGNFTGQVVSDSGSVRVTFDNSPSDGSFGALMGFIEADEMRELDAKTEEEVKAAVLEDFVRYFGQDAGNVTEFVLQRWDNEEFFRGAPVAFGPPKVLTNYGPALRQPVDGIHFAGTETAEYWTGYMDGAIRSGERVAKEILGL